MRFEQNSGDMSQFGRALRRSWIKRLCTYFPPVRPSHAPPASGGPWPLRLFSFCSILELGELAITCGVSFDP